MAGAAFTIDSPDSPDARFTQQGASMAHVIPFKLPETAKTQKRPAPFSENNVAKVTYLGAIRRQKPIRVVED